MPKSSVVGLIGLFGAVRKAASLAVVSEGMHAAVNGDYAKVRDCVHLCEAGACGKQQPAPDDEERVNAFHVSLSGRGDGFI